MKKFRFLLPFIASTLIAGVSLSSSPIVANAGDNTYTLTFNGMRGTGDNIHSRGVWPGNGNGSCTNQYLDSTASGGYCGEFAQTGANTFKGFAWANAAGSAFTEEGTYGVYFRYKTSATNPATSISFEWPGDWEIKKTVSDLTAEWKECYFTMPLTSTNFGDGTCLFDINGDAGKVYIDDLTCILIDRKVTENSEIGVLPDIPEKSGCVGTWQIDGQDITSSTLYTYGENKTAYIKYSTSSHKLVFGGTGKAITANMFGYTAGWWSASKGNDGHTADGTTATVDFSLANGGIYFKANVFNYSEIVKDGSYCMTFDYYAESDLSFNVQHNNVALSSTINATNKWQTYSIAYTCLEDQELLKFENTAKSGIAKFKNLIISEVGVTKELKNGDVIGELPEVPSKEGAKGYWTIDGITITSETVYSFETDKTAIPTYKYGRKLTFVGSENDYMKDLTLDKSKWLVVPDIHMDIKRTDEALSFKGIHAATSRFIDEGNFKLVEGKQYRIKFFIKTGDAKVNFVINAWKGIVLSNYSSSDWSSVDTYFVAPAPYVDGGKARCGFDLQIVNNTDKTAVNEISLKEMVVTSISDEHAYYDGDVIANLPSAPANSAWTVDNEVLVEGKVYPYLVDKQAFLTPVISNNQVTSFDYHIDHKLELDLNVKTFYYGETTLVYEWYKNGEGEPLSKPTEVGQHLLKVYVVDCNGSKSLVSANYEVNVLEKDTSSPDWIRADEVYVYQTGLTIYVKKGTYAQLNLEAYDELDGFVIVEYNYGSMVDILGRFVEGEGDIICSAKDLTNNQVQLIVHIIAQ